MNVKDGPRKILFVIPSFSGGGAQRVLINILRSLDRERFTPELVVFSNRGEYLKMIPEDVAIYDLKKKDRIHFLKLILTLAYRIFPRVKPDLVVSFLEYTNIVVLLAAKISFAQTHIVISERNYASISLGYRRFGFLRSYMMKRLYPLASRIISVSQAVAKDLCNNYGIQEDNIRVILNGVDTKYVLSLAKTENNPDGGEKFPVITACGRLKEQKNYPLLLEAVAEVQKYVHAELVILGRGELQGRLESICRDLGISDRVRFLGFQENPYRYMAGSDIFVLSSDWEGFPNVVIEAMACGVAVISTKCPSGPDEIITDGKDGLLIPVGDKTAMTESIVRLLKDRPLRKRLAEEGKKRAEELNVQKMISEYTRVFDEVLNNG